MLNSVLKTIYEYDMMLCGERVVCAVSGGADSVGMLCALRLLSDELKISLFACHLNHGLRGEESLRDEKFVSDLCERLGIPLYIERVEIPKNSGVEERAREERYAFFARALKKFNAQKIATAHNAEDNLETLIFHLVRGSGLKGLCGIPPVRENIVRPMLFTSKKDILNFLDEQNETFVEDSTNAEDIYTRNLIRHKILPVLSEINPDAVGNSARCMRIISKDEEALNAKAYDVAMRYPDYLPIELSEESDAILSRIIKIKCEEIVKNKKQVLDFLHICDIINLMRSVKTTGKVSVSDDLQVHRAGERLYFVENTEKIRDLTLKAGESTLVSGCKITCNSGEILIRARKDGDKIKLSGRRTRLIKKILCDAKIPQFMRDQIPVIEKDGEIIALCGFGFAEGKNNGGVTIEVNA